VASATDQRYAGFWLRVSPAVFDLIVWGFALTVFVTIVAMSKGDPQAFLQLHPGDPPSALVAAFGRKALIAIFCFFILSGWLYYAVLESSRWQGTFGKKFFGLIVTDLDGNRLTFARASRRFFCRLLLLSIPYIGGLTLSADCLCAAATPRKQALHDVLAGCLVLKKEEAPGLRRE
jgi:uncharacterized RDD family membrane protein YckC